MWRSRCRRRRRILSSLIARSTKTPALQTRQYTSLNTNRNSAERQGNEKGKCREFHLPRETKTEQLYVTEWSLFFAGNFSQQRRCHWVLRGHMASNNETVSCQNLRGGNIAKSMITSGKQKEGSLGRYYNLVPRVSLLASRKNPGCGWSRGSQNLGAERKGGKKINNYRYDKSYSV